jgi:hypothetical protein
MFDCEIHEITERKFRIEAIPTETAVCSLCQRDRWLIAVYHNSLTIFNEEKEPESSVEWEARGDNEDAFSLKNRFLIIKSYRMWCLWRRLSWRRLVFLFLSHLFPCLLFPSCCCRSHRLLSFCLTRLLHFLPLLFPKVLTMFSLFSTSFRLCLLFSLQCNKKTASHRK